MDADLIAGTVYDKATHKIKDDQIGIKILHPPNSEGEEIVGNFFRVTREKALDSILVRRQMEPGLTYGNM